MGFYALRVSRDGARLHLGMAPALRASLLLALMLVLTSLFATGRWAESSAGGRLGSGLVLAVLALAAFYRDEYELDSIERSLVARRGFGPFRVEKRRPLSDLRAIELSVHGIRKPGFGDERRASVSLDLGGGLTLLERSMPEAKARALAAALKAFLGEGFEVNLR